MEHFITILQTTQNRDRIFNARLIDHNRLETTLQRRVFFDVFAVLIQSRGTDTVQLTSCQHRLQHVSGIHCTVCLARADDQMQLIDKQDDLALTLPYLFQYRFQTLLKLTAVFCTCNQCTHIQCENLFILQSLRYIAAHNTLRQTFYRRRLADTRFTDQHRIVFCLS